MHPLGKLRSATFGSPIHTSKSLPSKWSPLPQPCAMSGHTRRTDTTMNLPEWAVVTDVAPSRLVTVVPNPH